MEDLIEDRHEELEQLADDTGHEIVVGTDDPHMAKGVNYVELRDERGEEYYLLMYPDGTVNPWRIEEVYADRRGNKLQGKTKKNEEVLLDDDGVHWKNENGEYEV